MHRDAVKEAHRLGGSFVYTCSLGFYYWTSPFFSGERFGGALVSAGLLAINRKKTLHSIFNTCQGEISHDEIEQYLESIPEKTYEDIKALAQIMLLCAEKISCSGYRWDDLHELDNNQKQYDSKFYLKDKERLLIASLRRGDSIKARKIVMDLLNGESNSKIINSGDLERLKMIIIEQIVLLSRAGTDSENNAELVEDNSRYFKRIADSKTPEELCNNIYIIFEQMAWKIFSFRGIRHASALRKAERYIWETYTRKVSLKEVAGISGLSAPYFSTIFKDEMGENLSSYLNRLRMEKASSMLRESEAPIYEISKACGFEDQSWFSKTFRSYAGISPCKYREYDGTIQCQTIVK
jgi:AraC-like DNA-binding protein